MQKYLVKFAILFFLYNYGSTQTYTKLKIYNRQTPKYSKVSGNEKKTNITKYLKKKEYIDIYYLNISY